ncbi:lasso peptide biosynthesis B2 protein [Streptomyces sp. NPDC094468]|uniref:lasso peptide biosynthesis B2 protein n=1 Tax=Streptomyces sp. NPDC094468 TaxID=3366066 RepID=UPI003817D2DB
MRVPPGVHRAPLGDGDLAVLTLAGRARWHWLNATTERVWAAALDGSVPTLVDELRAEGMDGPIETIAEQAVAHLTATGLLTESGAGTNRIPPPLPALTRPVPGATPAEPPLRLRLLASTGLLLALALMRLPLRTRMALLRATRPLPPAAGRRAAAVHAAVLRIRPGWWPGRIACMEVSLATVVALALSGRRAHWVLGARHCPSEAHAWVWTPDGATGLSGRDIDDPRRPWTAVAATPPVHPHE